MHLGVGTSQRPSSDIYTGERPFSEKVTYNVGKYLYQRRLELKGYIDFHAYSQMWMSPWGYTRAYPPQYDKMVSTKFHVLPPRWRSEVWTMSDLGEGPLRVRSPSPLNLFLGQNWSADILCLQKLFSRATPPPPHPYLAVPSYLKVCIRRFWNYKSACVSGSGRDG